MRRRVFKSGNSTVIALPKEAMDRLGVGVGDEVELEFGDEEREIILKPAAYETGGVDVDFARQVAEFIAEYRPALEALARQ